jgi:hypothetical protein
VTALDLSVSCTYADEIGLHRAVVRIAPYHP